MNLIQFNNNNIIQLKVEPQYTGGYGFRGWRYAITNVKLLSDEDLQSIYLDTRCTMSLIDREFFRRLRLDIQIQKMVFFMIVKGIGTGSYNTNQFIFRSLPLGI